MTPTQLTLKRLRAEGIPCEVVEHFVKIPGRGGFRKDLCGVIDILALPDDCTLGIQACAGASHAARRTKILSHPGSRTWLSAVTRRLQIWSWRVGGKAGKRKQWQCRVEEITLADLKEDPAGKGGDQPGHEGGESV